jgi:hypothetical protein
LAGLDGVIGGAVLGRHPTEVADHLPVPVSQFVGVHHTVILRLILVQDQ